MNVVTAEDIAAVAQKASLWTEGYQQEIVYRWKIDVLARVVIERDKPYTEDGWGRVVALDWGSQPSECMPGGLGTDHSTPRRYVTIETYHQGAIYPVKSFGPFVGDGWRDKLIEAMSKAYSDVYEGKI